MNQRDYSYYEAHAADVSLDEITSSFYNKQTLQRLRDGNLNSLSIGGRWVNFVVSEGDDVGWLGYFISTSESLQELTIEKCEDDGSEQRTIHAIHALSDGIARNRSIQNVRVNNLSNGRLDALFLNLTQLESLTVSISGDGDNALNECVALGNLLESGLRLQNLSLSCSYRNEIGDAGVTALSRGLRCIGSSLKGLHLPNSSIGDEGLSTLAAALVDCTCLEVLDLSSNDFSMTATGLRFMRSIGSSLKVLNLAESCIEDEGLSTLVAALVSCTRLKILNLSGNDFSLAAAGLRSLSGWVQTAALPLDELNLEFCEINGEGLRALIEGTVNNCKEMNLHGIYYIGKSGWRNLSTSLRYESCILESLILCFTGIEDDGAEILSRGLVGNKLLKRLHLCHHEEEHISITPAGLSAFVKVLCDTSTINNTYLSNHTIRELWDEAYGWWDYFDDDIEGYEDVCRDLDLYLELNRKCPQLAARRKILMHHKHLDMAPLLQWELKCLPLAIDWFERAKPCITRSIEEEDDSSIEEEDDSSIEEDDDSSIEEDSNSSIEEDDDSEYMRRYRRRLVDESAEEYQSRVLTAIYEFVRGMPKKVLERRGELILVAAYDEKIKRLLDDVQQRKRKNSRLNKENKRLRRIVHSSRDALDD